MLDPKECVPEIKEVSEYMSGKSNLLTRRELISRTGKTGLSALLSTSPCVLAQLPWGSMSL